MQITRSLKINEKDFYAYLENEIISKINQSKSANDIKKIVKYTKNIHDNYSKIDIIIKEYLKVYIYKFKFKTITDNILISYETKTTEDIRLLLILK